MDLHLLDWLLLQELVLQILIQLGQYLLLLQRLHLNLLFYVFYLLLILFFLFFLVCVVLRFFYYFRRFFCCFLRLFFSYLLSIIFILLNFILKIGGLGSVLIEVYALLCGEVQICIELNALLCLELLLKLQILFQARHFFIDEFEHIHELVIDAFWDFLGYYQILIASKLLRLLLLWLGPQ